MSVFFFAFPIEKLTLLPIILNGLRLVVFNRQALDIIQLIS